MAITSNLYPPIVLDSMPAFDRHQECRIYFALPVYNSLSEIRQNAVQISVINQKTNAVALNLQTYKAGIKVAQMQTDSTISNDYKYYVTISTNDLKSGVFELNTYYKVQLRFTPVAGAAALPSNPTPDLISTWIYNNVDYFSEWSSIVLIKGIQTPKILITGLSTNEETILTTSEYTVSGKYYYEDNNGNKINEKEYLKSYKIFLYKIIDNKNVLVFQSENIYTTSNARNQINYQIQQLEDGESYLLKIQYTTINSYQNTASFNFTVVLETFEAPPVNINAQSDPDNARNKIEVTFVKDKRSLGNFTIRRSSSKNNFRRWEDVNTFYFNGAINDQKYIWYDYTIESGLWYKYCIQAREENGKRSVIKEIRSPIMCEYEDMFLVGGGRQLKIQFNPVIGDFRYNVVQSQQVTIGSKYPFVKRNSENYYRTFSIGGLISSLSDYSDWYDNLNRGLLQKELFTSKKENYGETEYLYSNYNKSNNIDKYNDFIYEKEFREKVYEFLYDNNAKLFKSAAQGTIIVKLMNIAFQPVDTLGRKLYSFSATAIQIAQPTLKLCDYYNIQTIGKIRKFSTNTFEVLGQLYNAYQARTGTTIWAQINNKHKSKAPTGYNYTLKKLKWIRIEFISAPYPIKETISSTGASNFTVDTSQNFLNANHGFLLNITTKNKSGAEKTKTIFIPARQRSYIENLESGSSNSYSNMSDSNRVYGFYELKGEDVFITNISMYTNFTFPFNQYFNLDYLAEFEITKGSSSTTTVKQYSYFQKVGQESGEFLENQSIISKIYNKHSRVYSSSSLASSDNRFRQEVISVNGINIEAPENTIVYIKDSKDTDFNKHIITNGYLQLEDKSVSIEGLYFYGIRLKENDLIFMPYTFNNFDQIKNPVLNGVYHIASYGIVATSNFAESTVTPSQGYSYKKGVLYTNEVEQKYSEDWALFESKNKRLDQVNKMYTLLLRQIENDFNNRYVYYQGKWYPLLKDNSISLPIEGIVNYICEIRREKL